MANGLVEPLSTAPAVTPPPVEPTAEQPAGSPTGERQQQQGAELPEELLKLSSLQALFAGQPPAVSVNLEQAKKLPEAKLILKNKDKLINAGLGFYRSLGGDLGVTFNQLYISGDEIKAADAAGQLEQVAPNVQTVDQTIAKSGRENPILKTAGPPRGLRTPPVPMPAQIGTKPPPAGAQRATARARVMNLQPGAPTSGPAPGSGRLLNTIMKQVV